MKHFFLRYVLPQIFLLCAVSACDPNGVVSSPDIAFDASSPSAASVAGIMSELPLQLEHLSEVYDAVGASSSNGYDEEYMLSDLFSSPGSGVGDAKSDTKASVSVYDSPLKDLFTEYFSKRSTTKAGETDEDYVMECLTALEESDMQIYWPYSDSWDGKTYPIITCDPGYGVESNYGYEISKDANGNKTINRVLVTEEIAQARPVWVINHNDDSAFTPLELFESSESSSESIARSESGSGKMLTIRSFKAYRNYDTWFGGASEFFIKCGAVDGLSDASEDDLKLYSPSVTDLMIVVKRKQIGTTLKYNTILLTDYSEYLDEMAFLVTEDDGGKRTSWKCSATVKYKSKSYGFDLEIPFNEDDDIVWRGKLTRTFFENDITSCRFGDVEIGFALQ